MWDSPDAVLVSALLGEGFRTLGVPVKAPPNLKLFLVQKGTERKLFVWPPQPGFEGHPFRGGLLCALTGRNAQALMARFPEYRPTRTPTDRPTFGFGDRLGLATPGHVQALEEAPVFPILAQQSVRENARTGRAFADVLADAVFGAVRAGWTKGYGADADHLKSVEEARSAAQLGYVFFTCDPSESLVPVERLPPREVREARKILPLALLKREYLGRDFSVPGLGELRFAEHELLSIALKYWRALAFAEEMYRALQKELPKGFDFELSVDETLDPTTEKEHLFLALELRRRGVDLTALAPRFPGALEKAVDYRGDLEMFRQALRAHVALARAFGPYRISLHSGSDKWSLYPVLAQETGGLWHVKTAGTSYLVALEVLARFSPGLFREIWILARERFPQDRRSYQVSAEPLTLPDPRGLRDPDFPGLFAHPGARQALHVTFGSVLQKYGEDLKRELLAYEEEYARALAHHLGRHLRALGVKEHG